eukprot:CAMPEP_0118695856 /NCGR_PEP_ID=MMETSP0800-20121206/13464_1 /TAXON_ID=210618 ORGANISM="Striatella unipunctata, Strain CCMP2910" /NCGR_SAMPLE_ID=MMETSP0800 /ASSEMBLY_ACC=CAM_ASM_000638 /LENGTH=310 /DNA_ID=CAMNT_0006594785 /DNA_START=239 /DNA_END=1168 /DNA_ORIENTATION=+
MKALQEKPDWWTEGTDTLVEVESTEEQYWWVLDKMRESMAQNTHISKLWRIQNSRLWAYYLFHKDERLSRNEVDPNEQYVWHGTSHTDPAVIYNDRLDGFMMQTASRGFWGPGTYFAANAEYSKSFSFRPKNLEANADRPQGNDDEHEMLLTKLLVGREIYLPMTSGLSAPPVDHSTGQRYNTVVGTTGESTVFVVYENGRAYPNFLIRFYIGEQDQDRSPFQSRVQAMGSPHWRDNTSESFVAHRSSTLESNNNNEESRNEVDPIWEYFGDEGWEPYEPQDQSKIESVYQDYTSNNAVTSALYITTSQW